MLSVFTPSTANLQGCVDDDGDGYCAGTGPGEDCDDFNPSIHPGADEYCDARDNDCDGEIDEDAVNTLEWYEDRDGDGYGNSATLIMSCTNPDEQYFINNILGFDCDDKDPAVYEGAFEECDGIDNNCDGIIDDGYPSPIRAGKSTDMDVKGRAVKAPLIMPERDDVVRRQEAGVPPVPRSTSTMYGGYDPSTGAAVKNGIWNFETWDMQGWIAVDRTKTQGGFRRITADDFSGSDAPLLGASTGSIWCGRTEDEVAPLCWPGGRGYGNLWNVEARKTFTYVGGEVYLRFHYFTDSETEWDLTFLYVESNGLRSDPLNSSANGNWAGYGYAGSVTYGDNLGDPGCPNTATITVPPVYLPEEGEEFTVIFAFQSDDYTSDEDGGLDTNGAFGFDNFTYMTEDALGAYEIVELNDFETDEDGWTFHAPCTGDFAGNGIIGPDGSDCAYFSADDAYMHAADISTIASGGLGHPDGQHVSLISPPVYIGDIEGELIIFLWSMIYNEYSILHGYMYRVMMHYYPVQCSAGGSDIWTIDPVGPSYYTSGSAQCGLNSYNCSYVPAGAESIKVEIEMKFDDLYGQTLEGTNLQKTTPLWDDLRLEVRPHECDEGGIPDLYIDVGSGTFVSGFQREVYVSYQCSFASASDVRIVLDIEGPVTCVSATDGGTCTGTGVEWDLGQLNRGEYGTVEATLDLSSAAMEDMVTIYGQIEPVDGDCNTDDNYDTLSGEVYGSWDPNAKRVSPEGFISNNELLSYHIDFQNVGTYQAYDVVIKDTIDQNLDLSTLTPGMTSHPCVFTVSGREATWTFTDINLPDSTSDEPGSHGFVEYEIRPVPGLIDGDVIENHAAIYFDHNPAVITNSVVVEVGMPVAVQLSFLGAEARNGDVVVSWIASFEKDVAGYHVYRSEKGDETLRRITGEMIPGRGGREVEYTFVDESPEPGKTYHYSIESIDISGERDMFQTLEVSTPAQLTTLHQNWPNPFNPSTTIKYYLPERCAVMLEIFDVAGKRIAILVSETQDSGQYSVEWNGLDQNGGPVSSGTYFYRLKAGKETISRKMVLLK